MFFLLEKAKNIIIFGTGSPEKLEMSHGVYFKPFWSKNIVMIDLSRHVVLQSQSQNYKVLRITIKNDFVFRIIYYLGIMASFILKFLFKMLCFFLLVAILVAIYLVFKKDIVYNEEFQYPVFQENKKALVSLLKTEFAKKISIEKHFYSSGLLPKIFDVDNFRVLPLVYLNDDYQGRAHSFLAAQYKVIYFLNNVYSFEKRLPLKECQLKDGEFFWIYASYEDDLLALLHDNDRCSKGLNKYVITSLNHAHNYTCQDFSEF